MRFAGGSSVAGSVVVEELFLYAKANDVLDAFEIESRIRWNFRFVVLSAGAILGSNQAKQCNVVAL